MPIETEQIDFAYGADPNHINDRDDMELVVSDPSDPPDWPKLGDFRSHVGSTYVVEDPAGHSRTIQITEFDFDDESAEKWFE